jgi:hypothetical protein
VLDYVVVLGFGALSVDANVAKWQCWEVEEIINLSISQHSHFSPEDGDSMFLRNAGIY